MILLVDDNSALVTFLVDVLSVIDRPIVTAGSVRAAVSLLKNGDPIELLITDFNLPDGKGIELSRVARQAYPGLKVLMMSGYDIETPGIEFILKPFKPRDIINKVRSLLE